MLKILNWNILLGGHDGPDARRFEQQTELVRALAPDVVLLQECTNWLEDGLRRSLAFEAATKLRGFVGRPAGSGMSTGVFVGPRLRPLQQFSSASHFHHVVTSVVAQLGDDAPPLSFASAHLCPYGADMRAREAYYLATAARPGALCLLGGDFNSLSPHDPEPGGLDRLPPLFRVRRVAADGSGFDRRALQILEDAGWIDLGRADPRPTVPAAGFADGEFVPFRCDHLLATEALAGRLRRFEIIDDARTADASDHLPLLAELEV